MVLDNTMGNRELLGGLSLITGINSNRVNNIDSDSSSNNSIRL